MSNAFSNKFVSDEKNLALLKNTMWGPNSIMQAEELTSHFTIAKDMRVFDLTCHDIAWEEYLTSIDPGGDEKWTLDMKAAEDKKYFNTIQLITKVV